MSTKTLHEALAQIVGGEHVSTDEEQLERYAADALSPFRGYPAREAFAHRPGVVVRPATTEQVAAVVRLANEQGTSVVPYGGGTGVMGGVVPLRHGGIVVDLKRMNRVLSVDPQGMLAEVEAGAYLRDVDQELSRHGLMLGHDPWSLSIATIGGVISTNSVGYRAARYGHMGAQVVAVEAVLPTGEVLRTRPVPVPSAGPDLVRLFVGSEGVFGIVTKAVLRVFGQPEERRFATYAFDSFERAFAAMCRMAALGLRPAVFDLTEEEPPAPTTLYLVHEGYQEEVEAEWRRAARVAAEHGGQDQGPQGAQKYWEEKYVIAERWKREVQPLRPSQRWTGDRGARLFDYIHVSLPVAQVPAYRRHVLEVLRGYPLRPWEFNCWTRPEFFSFGMSMDREALATDGRLQGREPAAVMAEAMDRLLTAAQDMGGGMEYCHGVGVKLLHLVAREWGTGLDVVRAMKRALDPNSIMNPGKLGLE